MNVRDVDLDDMFNAAPPHLIFAGQDTIPILQSLVIDPSYINVANLTVNIDIKLEDASSLPDRYNFPRK